MQSQAEHEAEMKAAVIPPEKVAEIQRGSEPAPVKPTQVPRFQVGALVPLNGVWFTIDRVEKEGIFLKAKAFTRREVKR